MNNFFGSKLNSILLLVLIILMVIAIKVMLKNPDRDYRPMGGIKTEDKTPVDTNTKTEIEGNKDDLVSFSIKPGDKLNGLVNFTGTVKGAYFFEGNIGISIADMNKKIILQDHAEAITEWMTVEPVIFKGDINLAGLPKGNAYFVIQNDNPSDMRELDKFIYIPVVID